MSNGEQEVIIEQRLDDPARFLMFTWDDGLIFLLPFLVGFVSRQLIPGISIGFIVLGLWRRLKGQGGLNRLKAGLYWFLPKELSFYRSFPASDVEFWRG